MIRRPTTRRRVLSTLVLCPLAAGWGPAAAQSRRSYAFMSLAGDKLTLVHPRQGTGTSIDRNQRQEFATADDGLDVAAMRAAEAVVKKLDAGAPTMLYATRDPKLFALQELLVESEGMSPELAQSLKELLAQSGATHLVLITKSRSDARIPVDEGHIGTGRLTGLGFYVDRHTVLRDVENGHKSTGFMAPFAHLRLSLVDAKTLVPVRQLVTRDATTMRADPTSIRGAWADLSAEQKVHALHERVVDTVTQAMPGLLKDLSLGA